ncbi:MAG: hypothetical protein ABI700_18765 [Chloroflexota bacterium]
MSNPKNETRRRLDPPSDITIIVLSVFVRRTHDPAALGKHYRRGKNDT